jgi:hypothetical protein
MSLEARLTVLSGLVVLFACDRGGSSPPPLEAVVEVALGGFHSCARTHDGSVFCWGMNHRGQAGRPPLDATQPRPARVHGLAGVQQLGLGDAHSCALRTDGAVLCWGDNESGQLGDGTTVSRDQPRAVPGLTGVVELSLGSGKTCVRTADESVLCFGQTHGGGRAHSTAPVAMPALAGAAQLAVGMTHSCAKMGDGTVRCWGSNFRGQLGDGTTVDHLEPMPVPGLTGVEQVAVGAFSSCARMLDETVRCWGYNGLGALGLDPSQEVVATPTPGPVPRERGARRHGRVSPLRAAHGRIGSLLGRSLLVADRRRRRGRRRASTGTPARAFAHAAPRGAARRGSAPLVRIAPGRRAPLLGIQRGRRSRRRYTRGSRDTGRRALKEASQEGQLVDTIDAASKTVGWPTPSFTAALRTSG